MSILCTDFFPSNIENARPRPIRMPVYTFFYTISGSGEMVTIGIIITRCSAMVLRRRLFGSVRPTFCKTFNYINWLNI